MKLYEVHFEDGRTVDVQADSYMEIDGRFQFFANGSPISDTFFRSDIVDAITLVSHDIAKDFQSTGGGAY